MNIDDALTEFQKPFCDAEFHKIFYSLAKPQNVAFDSKIINTPSKVLGIRVPELRKIANILTPQVELVLSNLKIDCYELATLYGLMITKLKEPEKVVKYLQNFVPTIDNWATCDLTCGDLKIIAKNRDFFRNFIDECLASEREFVVRFSVILLMKYYLTPEEIDKTFAKINKLNTEKYYINMAIGWFICEAFLKNREKTLEFLRETTVSSEAVNKGIRKICESLRVSAEDKQMIKKYKRVENV